MSRLQLYPVNKEALYMEKAAEKISSSELEVMEALWQSAEPVPISQVRTRLEGAHSWDGSTVKTLLRRLCEKGAVEAEKRDVYYYRPLLSRQEYQAWSTQNLLDRVYRGSARDLVACLVRGSQLSREDLEELRCVLYPERSDG